MTPVERLLAAFAKMPHPLTSEYVERLVAHTLGDLPVKARVRAFVSAVEAYERDADATAAGFWHNGERGKQNNEHEIVQGFAFNHQRTRAQAY